MSQANVYFDPDIKTIFAPYVEPMLDVGIATSEGVFSLDLSNYESVKRLHERIRIALHGHFPETRTAHPMPPPPYYDPLKPEDLQAFDDWVAAGMPEKKQEEAS
jgi:hypothetical protein